MILECQFKLTFFRPKSRSKNKGEVQQVPTPTPQLVHEQDQDVVEQQSDDEDKMSTMKRLNAQRLGVALRNDYFFCLNKIMLYILGGGVWYVDY